MHTFLVHAADAMSANPFRGCPFDTSEFELLEMAFGINVGDPIMFATNMRLAIPGEVVAIAWTPRDQDGDYVLFLVRNNQAFTVRPYYNVFPRLH